MRYLVALVLLVLVSHGYAQDTDTTYWKRSGVLNVNFSNVGLTNWAAGGANSISGVAMLSLAANYKKDKWTWDNTLDLGYGVVKQDENDFFKSDDKIDLNSKLGRYAFEHWYYTALLQFKTQFAPGYKTANNVVLISDFFAPAYTIGALGMDYKPNKKFTAFISPVTAKLTFVNNQTLANQGAFGVEKAVFDTAGNVITPGSTFRQELGGFIKIAYADDIAENVRLETKIDLFSNYLNNPENIDINWETLVSFKVNDYIKSSLTTHLIYDDDIDIEVTDENDNVIANGPRTQFKYVFALGFSYNFHKKKPKPTGTE